MKNIKSIPLDMKSAYLINDQKKYDTAFNDNLEHIEALEHLAKLYLINFYIRNNGTQFKESLKEYGKLDAPQSRVVSDLPVIDFNDLASGNISVSAIENHLLALKNQINLAVQNSLKKGVHLLFENICASYQLDEFERMCVILLLANNTSRSFRDINSRFGDDPTDRVWGMSIGSLISIIEPEYRAQLISRKYFSIDSKLLRHNIVVTDGSYDKTRNILYVMVYLHERLVRFILGDNNIYDNGFNCISKQNPSIQFNQVVLDEKLKTDILDLSKHFLKNKDNNKSRQFEQFYGYGTGLAFLFYGSSGTGKTMFAHALAKELNMQLLSLNFTQTTNRFWHNLDNIVAYAFNEAKLCNAIVFFDECDDLLAKDTLGSRSLLIEIEKSDCITILATNKASELDPSLDRRISMKVQFRLPDETEREKIWKALTPPGIQISKDVDFNLLSKKYIFTGGLIKNTIFTAITKVISQNGKEHPVLTIKDLEYSAEYQAQSMFRDPNMEIIYTPQMSIQQLPVRLQDKKKLTQIVTASKKNMDINTGLKIVLSIPDIKSGMACVEAVAYELDFKIKLVDIDVFLGDQKENDKALDFIKQSKIHLFDYIFSNSIGHRSIILIKDQYAKFRDLMQKDKTDESDEIYSGFLKSIHRFNGFVFLVTTDLKKNQVPFEFHHYISIQFPSEEDQIKKWEAYVKKNGNKENSIVEMVERFPMHLNEIDQVAEHAMINAIIENDSGALTIKDVQEAIKKYKQVGKAPLLFGAGKSDKEEP